MASSHGNALQHVALSAIVAITSMLESMDYDSQQYEDTPYRSLARQMSYLTKTDSLVAPGMLKVKKHDAHGISKYRKGAEKCKTTGSRKKPKSCSFCQGDRLHFP